MLHCYLILHGLQKLIPAKFREQYPELAVGRRWRRQDMAANEVAEMVSTVGFESSLWSSDTWAGKLLKSQKKYRKITFAEDLVSYFPEDS
jgi:hypothetical protein